jgi:hypothetical protein
MAYDTDAEDPIYVQQQGQRLATAKKVLETIRRYKPSGKLLDIGCATGDFLSAASAYYASEGLELSSWASSAARQKGFTVHQVPLENLNKKNDFDILTLWGVIEHFEFPGKETGYLHSCLKRGGIVCLWTGDFNSLPAKLLGKKWWYIQAQHIQLFTRKSLEQLFHRHGFETLFIGKYPYVATAASLRNSLSRYPLASRVASMLPGKHLFKNLTLTLKIPGELFAIFKKK